MSSDRDLRPLAELLETLVTPPQSALLEVADKAIVHARALLDADGAAMTERRGRQLHYVAGVGLAANLLGRVVALDDSFTGTIVLERKARAFHVDAVEIESTAQRARADEIRCGLIAPIFLDDEVVGTIGVASRTAARYGEDDLPAIEQLAGFVSNELMRRRERIAQERKLAWARLHRLGALLTAGRLGPLATVAAELQAATDADSPDTLRTALARASAALDTARAALSELRLGAESDRATVAAVEGRPITLTPPALPRIPRQRIDLADELAQAAATARSEARGLAQLRTSLPTDPLPTVAGPPGHLAELVVHMVLHQLDAIPWGFLRHFQLALEATLAGTATDDAAGAQRLVISVSRTSDVPGRTPRGDLAYDPFAREGRASDSLSLAIVRRNIGELGGALYTSPGGVLRVELPLAEARRGK